MKIDEQNLVSQLQLHNERALIYVVDAYGGLLMSIIRKHLYAMPEKQEECFSDVLLKIWEHIHSFDERKNSFQNWIAAIARYRAIDYLRNGRREREEVSIEATEIATEDQELNRLVEGELSRELKQMLSCLTPLDQQLFLKLYAEEESMEQVSLETGLEKGAIYNRLSRARKKIRRQFQIEGGFRFGKKQG